MKKIRSVMVAALLILVLAGYSYAIPVLQLDLLAPGGGVYYDGSTETIMVQDVDIFTVYALMTPKGNDDGWGNQPNIDEGSLLADTYYLSVALAPQTAVPTDYGFFTMTSDAPKATADYNDMDSNNDGAIAVTGEMVYGTPPIEITVSSDDLPDHGIFPTYYQQFSFNFVDDGFHETGTYNTQDDYGKFGDVSFGTDGTYYIAFNFDISAMPDIANLGLHFDLFSVDGDNVDPFADGSNIYLKAPFSHDAQVNVVPEPATLFLLGSGLAGAAAWRKRRKA